MKKNNSDLNTSSLSINKFRLCLLPLSHPPIEAIPQLREATACWEKVWLDLFDQHQIGQPLFLDQLLRQDEAAAIFTDDTCVGMILFRTVDFAVLNYRRDSYFKDWSDADISQLTFHGTRVFVASYLTVHPDFRGYSTTLKFKEVLLDIMIKRFFDTRADVISGITRRDRGIHEESYRLGAQVVREDVGYMENHFRVDLVAFYRHRAKESQNPQVSAFSNHLWERRTDFTNRAPTMRIAA